MKNLYKIILFSLLYLSFYSCRSSTNIISSKGNNTKGNSKFSAENFKKADPFIKTADFENINITTNINGHSISLKASMKIVCDSMIQISIQPMMGIEMARINLTPQKILLINKINSKLFETDYDYLNKQTNNIKITFFDLQALLLNKIFIPNMGFLNNDGVLQQLTPESYPDGDIVLKSNNSFNGYRPEFTLENGIRLIYSIITTSNGMLKCTYEKFQQSGSISFPYRYKLSLIEGAGSNNINEAIIEINNVEFNQPLIINQLDIENYKRVKNIEDLLPKIGNSSNL